FSTSRFRRPRADRVGRHADDMSASPTPTARAATFTRIGLDALPPGDVAKKAESVGVTKAGMRPLDVFVLGVLAGAFIALGAAFAAAVRAGGTDLPYGVLRLLVGLAFTLGLILVVVAGAELFTGNNLLVRAWASRRISSRRLLRNWGLTDLCT